MQLTSDITITKSSESRIHEVDFSHLEFGRHTTDHMFVADYKNGEWQSPQIIPYSNLSLNPVTLALHYGQTVFEGMKAFRMKDKRVSIFRPFKHLERFNTSLTRMCMPNVPEDLFIHGIHKLVEIDRAWVPSEEGSSLYIRPFMIASEERFGVKVSDEYKFIIVAGPVGPYYATPLRLKVEREYVRAARGGTGYAKCGGNYGGAFLPTQLAKQDGYDQVMWTDATEHKYIEECGTMNLLFRINDLIVTPTLSSSILDGVTRDSILTLAGNMDFEIEKRQVSVEEISEAFKGNIMREAFGAGTAAVVAPVQTINIDGEDFDLPAWNEESFMMQVKLKLSNIRRGVDADNYEWNYII